MKFEKLNAQPTTPEDKLQLENLKKVIDRALADGKLSRQEIDQIRTALYADGKVTVEEMEMYRTLITEKVATGEIQHDYDW